MGIPFDGFGAKTVRGKSRRQDCQAQQKKDENAIHEKNPYGKRLRKSQGK
jgi:hypothetical protein